MDERVAADALVRHNVSRKDKRLSTDNEAGAPIALLECQTETHEARAIAAAVEKLRNESDLRYGEFAIFYRTNAQSRALEQGLRERTIPSWP
jgi:DNA helicase-2/ATP-dependent DNA helicase PcrA